MNTDEIRARAKYAETKLRRAALIMGVPDGGQYINDWQARADANAALEAERDEALEAEEKSLRQNTEQTIRMGELVAEIHGTPAHDRFMLRRQIAAAEAEVVALRAALERAAFIADNLHAMIDPETWRDSGGDDSQGHYEGDYRAEQCLQEIQSLAILAREEQT